MSKYRHEQKYLINESQKKTLDLIVSNILHKDIHSNEKGQYLIRSVYLDNIWDECLNDNIYGKEPRTKYRVRYYNDDSSHAFLEKKTKRNGLCYKETVPISANEYIKMIYGEPCYSITNSKLKNNMFMEIFTKQLLPKVIVTYTRTPYVYQAGNVRVTFDENISSSKDINAFFDGNYCSRPIMEINQSLLEVKWDEFIPKHIVDTLKLENLNQISFSKYYMCSTMHL